ncbi:MAG: heme-binding domain-containing protein [Gemmatimonadaceae bacterium]
MRRLPAHALFILVTVGAVSRPLDAQQNAQPTAPPAMPAKLAPSGPVGPNPAWEKKFQDEVKALDGYKVTLFAESPFAEYPTCVAATLDGVVFVGTDPNLAQDFVKGRGRVVRLVDENGDGRADRYTVFADVDSPRGLVWDGMVLYVLHPPNLTAYYDDNGDGIADRSVDLVKGISAASLDFRSADHSTNGITLGIDGWIYVAVGDYGFVKAVGRDGIELAHHGGGVARVRTDGSGLEMYATGTRNIYDLGIDPFLHIFARDNTNDGGGWDTRMHYLPAGADMGYPSLFQHFASEHMPSIFDYGPGAGTAGLWLQDPGFPADANDMFYSGDWTLNRIYRHPMERKGASFTPKQQDFLTVPHPTDVAMDGRSNMYVSSLSGGVFRYIGDSVGYIVRVSYPGKPAATAPRITGAAEGELLTLLSSADAEHRLQAQRELWRRGRSGTATRALELQIADTRQPAYARVAAMFTLAQLDGTASHAALQRAAQTPALRAWALRALTDRRDQVAGLSPAIFVTALADADPDVKVQAITSLVRLGATSSADAIAPFMGSADPVIAHLATNALVSLDAREAALKALDTGAPAVRTGALHALERMHSPQTVAALMLRAGRTTNGDARRPLLVALARLYNVEAIWLGDWWTTHPSTVGPYYAPQGWSESLRIRPVLADALIAASGPAFTALADDLALNGVLPAGSAQLLAALTTERSAQRAAVIQALTGRQQVDEELVATLASLDGQSAGLHAGVAELVSAQSTLPASALPLLRRASLDNALAGATRAKAVASVARLTAPGDFPVVVDVMSQVNPVAGSNPEVEAAWRRYVGDRARGQQLDQFIELSHSADDDKRVLAFAVLAQMNRAARGGRGGNPAAVQKLTTAIDAGWADPSSARSLVRAIAIMKLESAYTDKLAEHQEKK